MQSGCFKYKHMRLTRLLFFGFWVIASQANAQSQPAALPETANQELVEVCAKYPQRIQSLFSGLDLQMPALASVQEKVTQQRWPEACEALLRYYQEATSNAWLRGSEAKPGAASPQPQADNVLADVYTFQEVKGKQPRKPNGGLDWLHLGPNNDDEWGWFLNRHDAFTTLLRAYNKTGGAKYAEFFNSLMHDWLVSNPVPAKNNQSSTWRVLEAGLRIAGPWPAVFFGFQAAADFKPATRILMLCGVYEHAQYVYAYHAKRGNHAAMELNGLATVALCWPEFKQSEEWYAHAEKTLTAELTAQVYPDGVQKELTSHYHITTLDSFEDFLQIATKAGRKVSLAYTTTLEKMYNYLAYTINPDGYGLLNSDSDLDNNQKLLSAASNTFQRPDWKYILTHGSEGQKPASGPSVVFPWAGQFVTRSGWNKAMHWSFFDAGPYGMGHQHNDKLNFTLFAHGRDLLVDAGRMYYKPDEWRLHFNLSQSHNVVLVDGKGQNQYNDFADKPLDSAFYSFQPGLDFYMATYEDGYGDKWYKQPPYQYNKGTDSIPGKHTRAVFYLHNRFWVVVDQIETDRPRTLSPLWHFHPHCTVVANGQSVATTDEGVGNLAILPVADFKWDVALVKGQESPIQGWYSETYNKKQPAYCAVYTASASATAVFAWVLYPAKGKVPAVKTRLLPAPGGSMRIEITESGATPVEVAVQLTEGQSLPLSGGRTLQARAAVLEAGKPAMVVNGQLLDKNGKTIANNE